MSSLLDKLKAAGSIKAVTVEESSFFKPKDIAQTNIPIINVAFTGMLDGGLVSGLTTIAGPSKHFKSNLGLVAVKAYMSKWPDAVCLFYDSEFGITPEYLAAHGIDTGRVIHLPIEHIEALKFDIVKKIDEINKNDKVIIFIDSMGNLASKKEVDDAADGKSVADMTRAKQGKSLFRIITPQLTLKDIPCIVVAHTYECGTEKMTVATPDRGNMSLKDIKVGDSVYTSSGVEQVLYTTKHEGAFITEIELENGEILEFTDGHRFIVNGEWKYVCDLCIGDELEKIKNDK